jgi:hypothetical protein
MPLPLTDTFQNVRPSTTHVNHNLKARFEESGGVGDLTCSDGPKTARSGENLYSVMQATVPSPEKLSEGLQGNWKCQDVAATSRYVLWQSSLTDLTCSTL